MVNVIGHRGAPHEARENTVDAFLAAKAAGADMVELDARRTADDALVVHHDAALDDGRLIIETRRADLPAWLPSLDIALDACAGMVVNVEIKNSPRDADFDPSHAIGAAVAAAIDRAGWRDDVIVSCFNLATIDALKAADPSMATGWLTLPGLDVDAAIETTLAGGHQALHPHDSAVTRQLIDLAHAAGLVVNTWTVDDVDRMRELAAWGIDGIVTNDPALAIAALRA